MQEPRYLSAYFDTFQESSRRSARVIVPILLELLEPQSVCDVGCARGTWLSVFRESGVDDVCGVDGEHVAREELEIPVDRFVAADLRQGVALERRFDLALCLEVAEHLPEQSAEGLVDGLASLAPAVLFSAAVPGQGGRGHVNEQWPGYWAELFERAGYLTVDCIRPRIWDTRPMQAWYAQNMLLFAERGLVDSRPRLAEEYRRAKDRPLALVHPAMFEHALRRPWVRLEELARLRDSGELSEDEFRGKLAKMISRWTA